MTSDSNAAFLTQITLVVGDLDRSLAFYRRFGWTVDQPSPDHAAAELPSGLRVEFDSERSVPSLDRSYQGGTGGTTVLGIAVPTRDEVDVVYAELTSAGHPGRQPPWDAFWGSRYAIVEDPDGNPVGLMSPADPDLAFDPGTSDPGTSDRGRSPGV